MCGCSSKKCNCCCSKSELRQLSQNLNILSVKSRLDILFLLSAKPHCVADLESHTDLSQSLISHHLADLGKTGLVCGRRKGKFVEYEITQKGKKTIEALTLMIGKGGEDSGRKKG